MDYPNLTFAKPDLTTFRNLGLAFTALEQGGNMPCIMNAANEIAVDAFLKKKIGFLAMSQVIEETMHKVAFIRDLTLQNCLETDRESRKVARQLIEVMVGA